MAAIEAPRPERRAQEEEARESGGPRPAPAEVPGPRLARQILVALITAYTVLGALDIGLGGHRAVPTAVMLACMAGVYVLQLTHTLAATASWPTRRKALTLTAQAVLTYLPFALFHLQWGGMGGFVAGSFLLLLRRRPAWIGVAAVVAAQTVIEYFAYGRSPAWAAYYFADTLVTGLFTYGMTRLAELIVELLAMREALAGLAIARERLRFARDLHDVLGQSLSSISLKSELTKRLIPEQPDLARSEIDEILAVSRKALSDVRVLSHSYRQLSLADGVASARAMLLTAGIRTLTYSDGIERLPAELDTVLATTLREGVTNVLRHSDVASCTITIRVAAGAAVLEIVNDGVDPRGAAASDPWDGSGLDDLAARLAAVGGTLTAGTVPQTGSYRLTARAPVAGSASIQRPEAADGNRV